MFRGSPIASTEIAEDATRYTEAAQLQKVGGDRNKRLVFPDDEQ